MTEKKLETESYKGVRDFYPADMAIQDYIFKTWRQTATSFGFEHYEASVLEPSVLYKSKGAQNEEMVNEQTYTFTDRGDREVTLRPEMTPTVARMVAGKRRELKFPVRWYSIPNLFRYERPQRGRMREHWQLNCDLFGVKDRSAEVEIISLAHQTLLNFGATSEMFEIKVNNRQEMVTLYGKLGIIDPEVINELTRLNDRKNKISVEEYKSNLLALVKDSSLVEILVNMLEDESGTNQVVDDLRALGIRNVRLDRTLARGFDYYTGTVFEIFDNDKTNNRSIMGGGRYDNLTALFSDDSITGVGFGFGDITTRDFLETHKLLPVDITVTAPTLTIIPAETDNNLASQKIAYQFRSRGISTTIDIGEKKLGKKISDAVDQKITFALIVGDDELKTNSYTLKNLTLNTTEEGTIDSILAHLISHN